MVLITYLSPASPDENEEKFLEQLIISSWTAFVS